VTFPARYVNPQKPANVNTCAVGLRAATFEAYYVTVFLWPDGVVVRALDLRLERSWVRLSAASLSGNNLGQVVHTRVPLSPSSIICYTGQGAVMPCGREGNRRSGVALQPCIIHLYGLGDGTL